MTPPPKHDDVGRKPDGLGQDSFRRRLLHQHDVHIWPPARQCAPCTAGGCLGAAIQHGEEKGPRALRATFPRGDHPDACAIRPRETHGRRDRRLRLV
jgi:hypothetical protein